MLTTESVEWSSREQVVKFTVATVLNTGEFGNIYEVTHEIEEVR